MVLTLELGEKAFRWALAWVDNGLSSGLITWNDCNSFPLSPYVNTEYSVPDYMAFFLPRLPEFNPGSSDVGFVVDKVKLGQVFSEYFGFSAISDYIPDVPRVLII
jgi:hypothetical protein